MRTPEFPKVIPKGSCAVTIYEREYSKQAKDGPKRYVEYILVYYQDGTRHRETSAEYFALKERADEVLDDLVKGRPVEVGTLKAGEREEYGRAKAMLAKIKQPLLVAVRHYSESVRLLGSDLVIEAAREYAKRHPKRLAPKLVGNVVTEFLAEKERQGRSERHRETLSSHCTRFAGAHKMNIGSVTAADVDGFLDRLNVGARTRDNYVGSIRSLFEFAKHKQHLPSDHDELSRVTTLNKDEDGTIEIYTPGELAALLRSATPQLVPFIAIGAFAGLRTSEIQRLEWKDVRFDSQNIVVQKGKVKKRGKSRRIVPMMDNLNAWLADYKDRDGLVWPHCRDYLYESLGKVATAAKVTLKSNALRHSFVSYRVADIKNVPQVALEAGNSPQMIDSNYRELVTDADAKQWFAIQPESKKAVAKAPRRRKRVTPA